MFFSSSISSRLILAGLGFILFQAAPVRALVLTEDTSWQGRVVLAEDILVPAGVSLSVAAGTRVMVQPAESTKIDPEYLSHQNEILVRGRLLVTGTATRRVEFLSDDEQNGERWAGIIVDGGEAELVGADLRGAEAALTVVAGRATLRDCSLTGNRYGLVAQGENSAVEAMATAISGNDYGVMRYDGARVSLGPGTVNRGNAKGDDFARSRPLVVFAEGQPSTEKSPPLTRLYRDEALAGTTVWQGRVVVDGQLRLPPLSRLFIMPGTVVEFTRKDTNGDFIGENGLQIQGLLIAKGTPEEPIVFRSGEADRRRGDWDAINILGSDLAQNLLEFCRIEDAYRGLHFHYANVAVNHVSLRNNYRGAQFQESVVSISASRFHDNKSGLQARDSELLFNGNEVFDNLTGANLFRLDLQASRNSFSRNSGDGLRVREGHARVSGNLLAGNRVGLLVSDAASGVFGANVMSGNLESGLLIRDTGEVTVTGNAMTGNGINGLSLRETAAGITGNLIAGNGERGVGIVSFSGSFHGNNLAGNGSYALGLEGEGDLDASGNWWGGSDLAREIYDRQDEPQLGSVNFAPALAAPVVFHYPLSSIDSEALWAGTVQTGSLLTVPQGVSLTVLPGTTSRFATGDSGLLVHGRLLANGESDARIVFTSVDEDGPSGWAGVTLERALGSRVENCDFRYADWGLHIHFVPMTITGCRFQDNDGGLRFRSGPMRLTNSLFTGNRIGLRSFFGKMEVLENEFTGNEIAIFVREGGAGVAIHRNNLHGNERYNLRLGDFDKEDVDARENWWGQGDPLATIFDGRIESYIGKVVYEPYLDRPLALELPPLPRSGKDLSP